MCACMQACTHMQQSFINPVQVLSVKPLKTAVVTQFCSLAGMQCPFAVMASQLTWQLDLLISISYTEVRDLPPSITPMLSFPEHMEVYVL